MNTSERKQTEASTTHTTHIGSVTGQVHTGSGDIHVGHFSADSTISTKEDFLALLQQLKNELDEARQAGLPEGTTDDALTEFEAAEREAKKDQPKTERILKRLESAKAILTAGAGVAAAAATATAAINKFIPLLQKAIETAGQIF